MVLFKPVAAPSPKFDMNPSPLPWEEGLGQAVFTDVNLARGTEGALLLRNLIAFPRVMTLSVVALFRQALVHGSGTRGHNSPTFSESMGGDSVGTGIVLFGLHFRDGASHRNLDERSDSGRLHSLRGSGGGFTGSHDFWAPLPSPGDLEIFVAWPAAGIPETRTVLDGSRIVDAAAALARRWS